MKIELSELGPVKRRLVVEVAAEEVERETDEVARRYAREAALPGFRPGKAPLSLVRTRFAREIEEHVRERLIPRLHGQATAEKGLRPLADPVLEDVSHVVGGPLRFETTFEVAPAFTLRNYRGVEAQEPSISVGDEDVSRALDALREGHARLLTEEGRVAATGDFILCDLEGRPEGGEAFRRERGLIEAGDPDNFPDFNEKILGAKAGDVLEFSIVYPPEHGSKGLAGRTVAYVLTVHEVKRKVVSEFDDEFAKDVGDFESLEALRNRVREDLEGRRREERRQAVRRQVLDRVLLENPIPLPDALVKQEVRSRLEEIVRAMVLQGLDPRQLELDWRKMRERVEEPARKSVHARLVLDAVAAAEAIEASPEEMDTRIREEAPRAGLTEAVLRERLARDGGLEALKAQVVREKSLDYLTSVANIQSVG